MPPNEFTYKMTPEELEETVGIFDILYKENKDIEKLLRQSAFINGVITGLSIVVFLLISIVIIIVNWR